MTANGNLATARTYALLLAVAASLVETGFALHDCTGPTKVLGGVCLLPTTPGAHPEGDGVIVAWTQHDRLAHDPARYELSQAIQEDLNAVLSDVLEQLGYLVVPFGQAGANLVVGHADDPQPQDPTGTTQWTDRPGPVQDGQA